MIAIDKPVSRQSIYLLPLGLFILGAVVLAITVTFITSETSGSLAVMVAIMSMIASVIGALLYANLQRYPRVMSRMMSGIAAAGYLLIAIVSGIVVAWHSNEPIIFDLWPFLLYLSLGALVCALMHVINNARTSR